MKREDWRAVIAALLVGATTAAAQDAERQAQPWTKWDLATGDWNRNRSLLEDRGFTFLTTYTSQVWGNVAGGVRPGATYAGLLQFGAELDFEKLVGWQGGSFNTTWVWIYGGNPTTSLSGALFPASGIEAPNGFRALDLWLQQKLFDDILTLRGGLFNADRDFTISQGAQFFLNAAFGWPILYDGSLGGPPAYPFAAPGLFAAIEPGGGWKFRAAALQGVVWPPGENPTNFYWRVNRDNGLLFLGEAEYAWAEAPLPGAVQLGTILESGYQDYVSRGGDVWGGSYFYGIIDQMIWREPGTSTDSQEGVAGFSRLFVSATQDRDPVGLLFNAGFTWTGLLRGRDEDAAGLGFVWTRLTPGEAADLEGASRGNEFVVEASYQAQLAPWFELQPDIQLLVQPGAGTALPSALVIGLGATIDF